MNIENIIPTEVGSKILDRRSFLRRAGGGAAALVGGSVLLANTEADATLASDTDAAVLNFALNLEYLEAEYYTYAVTGQSITAQGVAVNGSGTPGGVIIKANPIVPFTPGGPLQQYALEVAADEVAHVKYLRAFLQKLGVTPVARPALDLQNSFIALGNLIGVPNFDPFASELNFLLGAFIFEDVGVTAYKGAAPLLTNKSVLEGAAGILAAESYHAATIRTVLFGINFANGNNNVAGLVQAISDVRDNLDSYLGVNADLDQGILDGDGQANIFPSNAVGLAFSRNTRQVLNIVYGARNATRGLFFPNGLNGAINR